MKCTIDLHAHSPYSGGSGKTSFETLARVMRAKGIDVYGSGDILLEKWEHEIDAAFPFDRHRSMWKIDADIFLSPQSELIITLPYPSNITRRKLFHAVLLFPDRKSISSTRALLKKRKSHLHVGRPFVVFSSREECIDTMHTLHGFGVSIILAHIMTPQGFFGGTNPVDSLSGIFGEDTSFIDGFESGLSADPAMLASIAHVENKPIVSFSDSHSSHLHRLGREFTQIQCTEISAEGMIDSIRKGMIISSAEFPPFEGKYYLTGHRASREGHHGKEIFFTENPPDICPICGKLLIRGVKDRIDDISRAITESRKFTCQIPLVEIISAVYGFGVTTKKTEQIYFDAIGKIGRESDLWLDETNTDALKNLPGKLAHVIETIKTGNISYQCGYDGVYGKINFNG